MAAMAAILSGGEWGGVGGVGVGWGELNDKAAIRFRYWVRPERSTRHYMNQWWSSLLKCKGITRPRRDMIIVSSGWTVEFKHTLFLWCTNVLQSGIIKPSCKEQNLMFHSFSATALWPAIMLVDLLFFDWIRLHPLSGDLGLVIYISILSRDASLDVEQSHAVKWM